MKNTFKTTLIAALLLPTTLLSGCGNDKGKPLSDYKDATLTDSMMYYYAQIQAYGYMKKAVNDPDMLDPETRESYLEGIRAGMEAMRKGADNEIYNRGVRRGARMARKILEFEKAYGLKFNDEVFYNALVYGMNDTTLLQHGLDDQKEFYRLYDNVRATSRENNRKQAYLDLVDAANARNLEKVDENLYMRITKKGEGQMAHDGDPVFVTIDFSKADGTNLGMPATERSIIGGPGSMPMMNRVYKMLNKGSEVIFVTTAEEVFGSRAEISGLDPDEALVITVTLTDLECKHQNQ